MYIYIYIYIYIPCPPRGPTGHSPLGRGEHRDALGAGEEAIYHYIYIYIYIHTSLSLSLWELERRTPRTARFTVANRNPRPQSSVN